MPSIKKGVALVEPHSRRNGGRQRRNEPSWFFFSKRGGGQIQIGGRLIQMKLSCKGKRQGRVASMGGRKR